MAIEVYEAAVYQDGGAAVMARIVGWERVAIAQADVSAITCNVYDLDSLTPTTAVVSPVIVVASSVFDTLQTDARWTKDSTGYNFRVVLPATALPNPGHRYKVAFKFTPTTGEVYWAMFVLQTLGLPLG